MLYKLRHIEPHTKGTERQISARLYKKRLPFSCDYAGPEGKYQHHMTNQTCRTMLVYVHSRAYGPRQGVAGSKEYSMVLMPGLYSHCLFVC
jgi:hypothetical protein